jgi:hypothetical protein
MDPQIEIEIVVAEDGLVVWWGSSPELEEISETLGQELFSMASGYCG